MSDLNLLNNSLIYTPYAFCFFGILLFILSVGVIRQRRRAKVSMGTGGDLMLEKFHSAHSNFTQYVPMILIGALMAEIINGQTGLLMTALACLALGRGLHAYGVTRLNENFKFRISGMLLTFASLFLTILSVIV
jgi:uncharacterized membrane protein YecN with MAPEG domain